MKNLVMLIVIVFPYLAQLADLVDFELKINLGRVLMTQLCIAFFIH